MSKKGEDAFVDVGFENWKKALERFAVHARSDLHKEAVLKIELLKQGSVHTIISNKLKEEQRVRREMLVKQISTLKYLTRQGLAVRGNDDLEGNLLVMETSKSKLPTAKHVDKGEKLLSPQVLNEQIALMGLNLLRGMLADMSRAHWFSLIADEATDISHNEQLAVCVRWVDDDSVIHEDPVELIHVPKTDADT